MKAVTKAMSHPRRRFATLIIATCQAVGMSASSPQQPTASTDEGSPSIVLQFLIGDWEALSKPGEGTGWTSFAREVQGHVVTRRNHAETPAAAGRAASTHDDLMVMYREGSTLRADYVDNEGHVIRYVMQSRAAGQVTFVSEAQPSAPRYRLSYRALPNGHVTGRFEIAPPGSPDAFTEYLTWEMQRK